MKICDLLEQNKGEVTFTLCEHCHANGKTATVHKEGFVLVGIEILPEARRILASQGYYLGKIMEDPYLGDTVWCEVGKKEEGSSRQTLNDYLATIPETK